MAQDKRVFTGGMDKDSDPRLIKNGDYRDALNIRNISSSDGTSGSVENIEGNTIVPNQTFIDETTEIVEITPTPDGNFELVDLEPSQSFLEQKLIFTGPEKFEFNYSFEMAYFDSVAGDNEGTNAFISIGGTHNYLGNTTSTATAQLLYGIFGPGAVLSNFSIPDINTGNIITIQADLDFGPNELLTGGKTLTVTLRTTQANGDFIFQVNGGNPGAEEGDEPFALTLSEFSLTDNEILGTGITVTYEQSFSQVASGVDTNIDDEDNSFGIGPAVPLNNTEYELAISGDTPSSPTSPTNADVDIFSYEIIGDGGSPDDFLVLPFFSLSSLVDKFESGSEYEFSGGKTNFSEAFTSAIDNGEFGNVLVSGGKGTTTSVDLQKTDFTSSTKLQGLNSGAARNSSTTNTFSQLEYYYNSDEVIEGDGFSISSGTLTFSGEDVLSSNSYILKSPIIRNKTFKISLTVSGLNSAGKTFDLSSANTFIGNVSKDGNFEFTFDSETDSSTISIIFNNNFTSSDSVVITNLRLFLLDEPTNKLSIRLACLNSSRFNLAFASSESELKDSLSIGVFSDSLGAWYPGVGLTLLKKSAGSGDVVPIPEDLYNLQVDLETALNNIITLNATISENNTEYQNSLANLNLSLTNSQSNADGITADLSAANALNDALEANLNSIYTAYTTLNDQVNDITTENISVNPVGATYAQTTENIINGLSAINQAIQSLNNNNTITNNNLTEQLNAQIEANDKLQESFNENLLELESANASVSSLSNANAALDNTIYSLSAQISGLQDQISSTSITQQELTSIIVAGIATVKDLKSQYVTQKNVYQSVLADVTLSSDVQSDISEQINLLETNISLIDNYIVTSPEPINFLTNSNFEGNGGYYDFNSSYVNFDHPNGVEIDASVYYDLKRFKISLPDSIKNSDTPTVISYAIKAHTAGSGFGLRLKNGPGGGWAENSIETFYSTDLHTGTFIYDPSLVNVQGYLFIVANNGSSNVVIESIELFSDTIVDVTTQDVTNLTNLLSSLDNTTLSTQPLLDGLNELQSEVDSINSTIASYSTTLGSLYNNLFLLQSSVGEVITQLSIDSSISQSDIDQVSSDYNASNDDLSSQIDSLYSLVTLLNTQIGEIQSGNAGVNPLNVNKWLMTLTGGIPILTDSSINYSAPTKKLKITNTDGWSLGGDDEVNLELINVMALTAQGLRKNNDVSNSAQQELAYFVRNANEDANRAYYDSFLNDPQGNFISPGALIDIPFFNEIGLATYLTVKILNQDFGELLDENGVIINKGSTPMSEVSEYVIGQTGETNGLQVEFSSTISGWEFEVVDQDENSTSLDSSQQSVTLFQDNSREYTWNTTTGNNIPSAPGGINYQLHFENVEQIDLGDGEETVEGTNQRSLRGSVESFVDQATTDSYSMSDVEDIDDLIYPSVKSDIIVRKSTDAPPNLTNYISGAKKYITNTLLQRTSVRSNLSSKYKCIGTYEDKPKSCIYYFINDTSYNNYDSILEYSLIDDKVRTVYQDGRVGSNGLVDNILNFSNNKAITGVNKIDDILYWTDNLNRPRKINVELAKKNEVNIDNAVKFEEIYYNGNSSSAFLTYESINNKFNIGDVIYTQASYEGVTSYNGYAEVTGIVRKMPDNITFNVNSTDQVTVSAELSNSELSPGEYIGVLDSNDFPRYYRVESISETTITTVQPVTFTLNNAKPLQLPDGNHTSALITNCPFLESFTELPGIMMFADPKDAYSPLISYGNYEDKMRYLDVVKHQPNNRPVINPSHDEGYAHNNILDNLFQFKYRYIHCDNENTSYSGISNIYIDPEFARNTPLKFSEYNKTANNLGVGYVDAISDVKKIEIVARKGNNGEFFLVETVQNNFIKYLKIRKNELISSADSGLNPADYHFNVDRSSINFKNNGVYPFIDKAESDKLFDAVPKLAKAQTIISDNRLTYGNVLEGYDNTPLVVKSIFETDNKPKIETTDSGLLVYASTGTNYLLESLATGNNSIAESSKLCLAISNEVGGNKWKPGGNKNCNVNFYLELNGLDLNDENSQSLNLDLGFSIGRKAALAAGGKTKYRTAKINMNIDITGLTTVNQISNKIIQNFDSGNYQGGLDAGDGANSNFSSLNDNDGYIELTSIGSRIKINFHFHDNEEIDTVGALWAADNDGWQKADIIVDAKFLSGAPGISSFKTGAFHDFGIAYFDETNRCSFVNTAPDFGKRVKLQDKFDDEFVLEELNGTRVYNKFPTEGGPELGQSSEVKFEVYNRPPIWATSYQFVYAGNTSVDEFMQVTIPHVIPGSGGGDTQMYLSLQSLKSHKSSYTESTSSLVDFDIADGDRIRFVSCKIGNERKRFTTYLDFEITGFDVYQSDTPAGEDTQPIATGAGEGGFYITIPNPGSDAVALDGGGEVSLNHSGFSLNGSGYDLLIAEIYRPRKTQSPENLVYYEIGDRYQIGNAGEGSRYHDGDTAQGTIFFTDKDVNTEVCLQPAVVTLNSGDVYMKARTMFTIINGSTFESFACEDYFLNDFHHTNHYDRGRINVINTNAAERRLNASVYYSETYVSTGAINGLSSFNLANTPYFDYNKDFGSIQSLKNKDNDLIIFHESKVGRVLVKQDILNTASGEGLVSLSNDVIGNYAKLYSGQFGCGLNPESIVKHGQKFYFADIKRGAILRLSTDGLTVVSDYGMKDYFRDIGEMYIKYNPDEITSSDYNSDKESTPYLLLGGYDPKYDEYVITIPSISDGRSNSTANPNQASGWGSSISSWDNVTSTANVSVDDTIFDAVTLAFSEGTNRWTSFYSFVPEFYSKINKQFVSFNQGRIYRHNNSDVYSRGYSNFNKFYGNQNLSYIDFVFNAEPSSVKTYNAIGIESDTKFITGLFTNMGQYYGNYSDVITTSIAFKKVKGTISNDSDDSNEIIGNNTNFYEDVSPGDLIRVFGTDKNGSYLKKDFIVKKVISNSLIKVNEPVNLELNNSYMLVIDYKSKEGIQYSEIPFAGSGIDSLNDNVDFGDGSDIQGVGSASEVITNDKSPYVTLIGDNFNVVDFNKPISPVDMVSGAEYAIQELGDNNSFDVSLSSSNLSAESNVVGTVFTSSFPQQTTGLVKVISTNYKLYYKNSSDNKTTFLGYIFSSSPTKIDFLSSPEYNNIDLTNGFLFVVKSGNIEGERMKGSYMRAILATNLNQSKSKFNLYAANADVDKSELSNR